MHKPYFTTELKNMFTHAKKRNFGVKQLILQNIEGGNVQKRRDITRWVAYRQLSSWRRETCMLPGPSTENVWARAAVSYHKATYSLTVYGQIVILYNVCKYGRMIIRASFVVYGTQCNHRLYIHLVIQWCVRRLCFSRAVTVTHNRGCARRFLVLARPVFILPHSSVLRKGILHYVD